MLKLISVVALLLCATFSASALAEAVEQTPEQIYNKIKQNESLNSHNVGNGSELAPWLSSENSKRFFENLELKKLLETKASRGDLMAMFYVALLKTDNARLLRAVGEKYTNMNMIKESDDEYDLALQLFKQAGDAGISAAYWNVAVAYANGHGSTSSKLAAIEWYYKAGVGYLKDGDRERALAALEAIQAIRMDSELGKRLEKQLNKGAPK